MVVHPFDPTEAEASADKGHDEAARESGGLSAIVVSDSVANG
ncbi:hypothetical protein [Microvirga subterranea]|nr:hypothetical protein [Microvirga subterranea]